MFYEGKGVFKDYVLAHVWLTRPAELRWSVIYVVEVGVTRWLGCRASVERLARAKERGLGFSLIAPDSPATLIVRPSVNVPLLEHPSCPREVVD